MKKTLIVMSSNRELEEETRDSLRKVQRLGAAMLLEKGSSDVAFARCRALSMACEQLRGQLADRDVVLMVDDDMEFDEETAQIVVDKARELGQATAAAYATRTSMLAATRLATYGISHVVKKDGLWLVGLGFVAIPVAKLLELEASSESFELFGKAYTAFTWCGPERGAWVAEDYRLSLRLGGVRLLPLAVGHIKKGSLWPDDETLEKIGNYEEVK